MEDQEGSEGIHKRSYTLNASCPWLNQRQQRGAIGATTTAKRHLPSASGNILPSRLVSYRYLQIVDSSQHDRHARLHDTSFKFLHKYQCRVDSYQRTDLPSKDSIEEPRFCFRFFSPLFILWHPPSDPIHLRPNLVNRTKEVHSIPQFKPHFIFA